MATVTRERTGELLRKLFEILLVEPEGLQAKDALAKLAASVEMTEHEAGVYEQGGRRFEKIVRFSTVDAVKAGWMVKHKGQWTITELGRAAYQKFRDPGAFYREAVRLYNQWRAGQPPAPTGDDGASEPDDPTSRGIVQTFEEAVESSWQEIERFLQTIGPYDLQELVASLLRAMGYHVDWVAPPGKDGGLDIIAFSDPLGTKPPRIKVQVKRQSSSVSVEGVRSFLGVLGEGDVGIFVNTGGFTKDAMDTARGQTKNPLTLIDLERLFDLWVENYDNLDDQARRRMPLRPVYFLAPQE